MVVNWEKADFAMELGYAVTNPDLGDSFLMRRPANAKPPPGYEQQVFAPTQADIHRNDWRVA